MSAEIIIIVVGALFILLAVGDAILSKDSSTAMVNAKLRIPLGTIGVLLIIYGGYSYGASNFYGQIEKVTVGDQKQIEYPIESVQVLSPIDGESVDCRILTSGVYPKGHDKDIWVLLKPSDNMYYPQSDHTNTSYKRNGEWQVITRFGGDKDEQYEVIVYETDSVASEFFSETIEKWKEALSYPGLDVEEIPTGAKEVDRIVVSLKDNCRGVF